MIKNTIKRYRVFIVLMLTVVLYSSNILFTEIRTAGGNVLESLLDASKQNNLDEVKKITSLKNISSFINEGNENGETALILAAKEGNIEIVNYLLYIGATTNKADKRGMTALMHSISESHIEIARALLAQKANPNFRVGNGPTALIQASGRGFYSIVQLLLDMGAHPQMYGRYISANGEETYDVTPLMIASYNNHGLVCRLLENTHAQLNPINEYGDNALIYAVGMQNEDIVFKLIEGSIQTDIIGSFQTYRNITPLALASALGNYEITQKLIDANKTNINRRVFEGKTALIWSVVGDNFYVVQTLIDNGANIDTIDNSGKSALMYAAQSGNAFIVKLLIDSGANVNLLDNQNKTALLYAMESSNTPVIKLLNERIFEVGSNY